MKLLGAVFLVLLGVAAFFVYGIFSHGASVPAKSGSIQVRPEPPGVSAYAGDQREPVPQPPIDEVYPAANSLTPLPPVKSPLAPPVPAMTPEALEEALNTNLNAMRILEAKEQ